MNKIKKWYDSIGCKSNIMAFLILMVVASVCKCDTGNNHQNQEGHDSDGCCQCRICRQEFPFRQ